MDITESIITIQVAYRYANRLNTSFLPSVYWIFQHTPIMNNKSWLLIIRFEISEWRSTIAISSLKRDRKWERHDFAVTSAERNEARKMCISSCSVRARVIFLTSLSISRSFLSCHHLINAINCHDYFSLTRQMLSHKVNQASILTALQL